MFKNFTKRSGVFYINTFLSFVALLFVVNILGLPGHTLIKRAWATVAGITGEGTVNYVARFATGANPSNSIGDSLIYDSGTNVGIGTTSPGTKLHIATGDILVSDSAANERVLKIYNSVAGFYWGASNSGTIFLARTNGSGTWQESPIQYASPYTAFNFSSKNIVTTGSVGIGTTNPSEILHIQKDQNAQTALVVKNTTTGTAARTQFRITQDQGLGLLSYAFSSGYTASGLLQPSAALVDANLTGGLTLSASDAAGVIKFATGGLATSNERMRITAAGNVGIGTTTPQSKLVVGGSSQSGMAPTTGTSLTLDSVGSDNFLTILANNSANAGVIFGSNTSALTGAVGYNNSTNKLSFNTNGNNVRMTIDGSGNVGIGTTSPSRELTVNNAGDAWMTIRGGDASYSGVLLGDQSSDSVGGMRYLNSDNSLHLYANGNSAVNIDSSGNVGIGTTTPGSQLQVVDAYPLVIGTDGLLKVKSLSTANGSETVSLQTSIDSRTDDYTISSYGGDARHLLVLQPQGGYVGIGTTTPSQKLEVAGTIYSTSGGFKFPDGTIQTTAGTTLASSGTTGAIPRFTGTTTLGDSSLQSDGISTTASGNFFVTGALNVTGSTQAVGGVHASGWFGTASGPGSEIGFSSGFAYLMGYDRTAAAYQPVRIAGSTIDIRHSNATSDLFVDASGNTTVGGTLSVTGTSTLTGNVGVGTVSASDRGLYVRSAGLSGTSQYGTVTIPSVSSAATSGAYALYARVDTAAAAFTLSNSYGVYIANSVPGSGATITNNYGLFIADQTSGSTNNYGVYSAGGKNYFAGNVGIGTTSPNEPLEISNATNADLRFTRGSSIGYIGVTGAGYLFTGMAANDMAIRSPGALWLGTNGNSPKLTIDTSGRVGIGVTSTTYVLDIQAVQATMNFKSTTGTNSAYQQIQNTSGGMFYGVDNSVGGNLATGSTAYAGVISTYVAKPLQFGTNNTVRMTIDSTGNVGIGTTGPSDKLDVQGGNIRNSALAGTGSRCVYVDSNGVLRASSGDCGVAGTGNVVDTLAATLGAGNDGGGLNMTNIGTITSGLVNGQTISSAANFTGTMVIATSLRVGGNTPVSNALVSAVVSGNGIEFGHSNSAGYRSTLGSESNSGMPFLAFNAEAGTNINTFKTRGIAGSVIESDLAGGFKFAKVSTANADNQSLTTLMTLSNAGAVAAGTYNSQTISSAANFTGSLTMNGAFANTSASSSYFTGNVGIGTSTPTGGKLVVRGAGQNVELQSSSDAIHGFLVTSNATTEKAYLYVTGGNDNHAGHLRLTNGNADVTFADINMRNAAGTAVNYITTSGSSYFNGGNVGIGTTAPTTAKLVINAGATGQGLDLSTADSYANLRVIQNTNSTFDKDIYIGYASGTGSKLHLYSNSASLAAPGTDTMTITGGQVGIGTTTPGAPLEVNGAIKLTPLASDPASPTNGMIWMRQ